MDQAAGIIDMAKRAAKSRPFLITKQSGVVRIAVEAIGPITRVTRTPTKLGDLLASGANLMDGTPVSTTRPMYGKPTWIRMTKNLMLGMIA
jgi:hypothetical protein